MSEQTQTEELSQSDRTELFLVQTRGTIATAFNHSGLIPEPADWSVIRGLVDPTMRQIAEIGYRTKFNLYFQLHDRV